MDRITIKDIENLPVFMTSKEFQNVVPLGMNSILDLFRVRGCPVLKNGRKYVIPTQKMLEWLEGRAGGAST